MSHETFGDDSSSGSGDISEKHHFFGQIIADYCKTYFQKCEMNFLYGKMFNALTLMFYDQMS